ncbi:hypothetical protein SEUCBS140593_004649 [Sporothrix eucalyptigena]|uniref:AB hydrolase-1 domain-containing protein n=1 Tax=Sporothrix eucalyptigena TaxID=1812306 RepID=A0ABP0BR77_9PEZI
MASITLSTPDLPSPMVVDGLEGTYADINGTRIFYVLGGGDKTKPLVLVHGLFQTGMMWRRVAPKLMEGHYLTIPDSHGYGMSEKPATMEKLTKKLQAQDLHELLLLLGVKKCVMLSHDRGARIARTFAMDYLEMLLGVSLMDMLTTEYIYQETKPTQAGSHHWNQLFKFASPMVEDLLDRKEANTRTYVNNFYKRSPGFMDILKEDGVYGYYMDCTLVPGAMIVMLNDYRAAYHIDVPRIQKTLDKGERIQVPVQVLWGSQGNASRSPAIDIFKARCTNTAEGSEVQLGHYLAEEALEETQKLLLQVVNKMYKVVS